MCTHVILASVLPVITTHAAPVLRTTKIFPVSPYYRNIDSVIIVIHFSTVGMPNSRQ